MSVGVFHSFRQAYTSAARKHAKKLRRAVNRALRGAGIKKIRDPKEPPYIGDGRIDFDHLSGTVFKQLGAIAGEANLPHLELLDLNPYRLVYVPRELAFPLVVPHAERILGERVYINLGSSHELIAELLDLAPQIDILVSGNSLTDAEAADVLSGDSQLTQLASLFGDPAELEDVRRAWLMMHEAAVISLEHDAPIVLSG